MLRVVGFTVCADANMEALLARPDWDARALVAAAERFLETSRRVVEADTGRRVVRAFFVRVADDGATVAEVLETARAS